MKHIAYRHFGLGVAPWAGHQATADVARVEMAVQAAVATGAMIAVVGPAGAGKTHAVRAALEGVEATVVTPLRLDKERLRIGDVLMAIITQVSEETPRPSAEARTGQVRRLLWDARRPVLLIEEAHALHPRTISALKRLRELAAGRGRAELAVILVGQADPTARIGEARLRTSAMTLGGLTREEALAALGRLGDALDGEARERLAESERARNWLELQRLADECLAAAMAEGAERVGGEIAARVLGGRTARAAAGAEGGAAPRPGAVAAVLGGGARNGAARAAAG